MNVTEIDPQELDIDPVNERQENVGPEKGDDSLEESIREQGVIQPPVVRPSNGDYKVVVGQRRTLAAQNTGINRIPVIIADFDDSDALAASITENADAFRKSVSRTDRAAAVQRLMEINDWGIGDVSEELGVNRGTAREWLERTKDEWEDTVVHVDSAEQTDEKIKESVDGVDDKQLATIRANTESKAEREKIAKQVAESELSQRDVLEASQQARRGDEDLEESIEKMKEQKSKNSEGTRIRARVTFSGSKAEGLREAAKDLGTSEEDVVRQAVDQYINSNEYI